ncbi:MAG: sulfite exporter TauE/SafE family protein [Chloroflexi bacterium HGW-Chloroflexi-6]|nr:MAG: sulfite exporter TauE/SafE family protein [Chloroflexi bacterium HGW-Chloroflexi-6]
MIEGWDYLFIGLAALAAGVINALAGGGTLISFPVLIAIGVPSVASNITNTVALLPGYLGGTFAQWSDIKSQMKRLWLILPASLVGGLLGGILLVFTGEKVFRQIVPYLILLASLLLAVQDPVRAWLVKRATEKGHQQVSPFWSILPIGLASVYGGYFGAGLSVIVLAALGLTTDESLTKLNALKQAVSFSVNIAAAVFFLFSGYVVWNVVLVMAICALIGGWLGGKLAGAIKPSTLRWLVVSIGFIVGIIYLIRG